MSGHYDAGNEEDQKTISPSYEVEFDEEQELLDSQNLSTSDQYNTDNLVHFFILLGCRMLLFITLGVINLKPRIQVHADKKRRTIGNNDSNEHVEADPAWLLSTSEKTTIRPLYPYFSLEHCNLRSAGIPMLVLGGVCIILAACQLSREYDSAPTIESMYGTEGLAFEAYQRLKSLIDSMEGYFLLSKALVGFTYDYVEQNRGTSLIIGAFGLAFWQALSELLSHIHNARLQGKVTKNRTGGRNVKKVVTESTSLLNEDLNSDDELNGTTAAMQNRNGFKQWIVNYSMRLFRTPGGRYYMPRLWAAILPFMAITFNVSTKRFYELVKYSYPGIVNLIRQTPTPPWDMFMHTCFNAMNGTTSSSSVENSLVSSTSSMISRLSSVPSNEDCISSFLAYVNRVVQEAIKETVKDPVVIAWLALTSGVVLLGALTHREQYRQSLMSHGDIVPVSTMDSKEKSTKGQSILLKGERLEMFINSTYAIALQYLTDADISAVTTMNDLTELLRTRYATLRDEQDFIDLILVLETIQTAGNAARLNITAESVAPRSKHPFLQYAAFNSMLSQRREEMQSDMDAAQGKQKNKKRRRHRKSSNVGLPKTPFVAPGDEFSDDIDTAEKQTPVEEPIISNSSQSSSEQSDAKNPPLSVIKVASGGESLSDEIKITKQQVDEQDEESSSSDAELSASTGSQFHDPNSSGRNQEELLFGDGESNSANGLNDQNISPPPPPPPPPLPAEKKETPESSSSINNSETELLLQLLKAKKSLQPLPKKAESGDEEQDKSKSDVTRRDHTHTETLTRELAAELSSLLGNQATSDSSSDSDSDAFNSCDDDASSNTDFAPRL